MRTKFIRGQDSKSSLDVGLEFLKKNVRIFYELTAGIANSLELKEAGQDILLDLIKIDSKVSIGDNNIFEDDITDDHYYGIIYAVIHTVLSYDEIGNRLQDHNPFKELLTIRVYEDTPRGF
jgi:hypothetical protein